MKLLKPSWVSHNGKLVQESVGPSWAFVVGEGGKLIRRHDDDDGGGGGGRHLTLVTCLPLNSRSHFTFDTLAEHAAGVCVTISVTPNVSMFANLSLASYLPHHPLPRLAQIPRR